MKQEKEFLTLIDRIDFDIFRFSELVGRDNAMPLITVQGISNLSLDIDLDNPKLANFLYDI